MCVGVGVGGRNSFSARLFSHRLFVPNIFFAFSLDFLLAICHTVRVAFELLKPNGFLQSSMMSDFGVKLEGSLQEFFV